MTDPDKRPATTAPATVATYTSREDALQAVEDLKAEGHTDIDIVEVGETQFEVTVTADQAPDAQDDLTPSVPPPSGDPDV